MESLNEVWTPTQVEIGRLIYELLQWTAEICEPMALRRGYSLLLLLLL